MDNQMNVLKYEIWQYNPKKDEYEFAQQIHYGDIYKWDYTQASGVALNVLDVELKVRDLYSRFVPKSKADTQTIQPIILKKMRYRNNESWSEYEALVFEYEETMKEHDAKIHFVGYDVKKIESLKLITTNKDYSTIREPEDNEHDTTEKVDLPLSFAKYVERAAVKIILAELYERALIAPRTIGYGSLGLRDKGRDVKGLGTVTIDYDAPQAITLNLEQIPLLEAKETLFSQLEHPLETHFETNNGKINIRIQKGKFLANSLIRKRTNILEHAYVYKPVINYVATHGKANVVHHAQAVKTIDFSSYEVQTDLSSIAGNNKAALVAPTLGELNKQLQDAKEFLALKVTDPFSFIQAGDYFEFNLKLYTIKQIKETIQAGSPDTYGFELEERDGPNNI